jgi:capsule polysaccharide export protein KpsE/RkpR
MPQTQAIEPTEPPIFPPKESSNGQTERLIKLEVQVATISNDLQEVKRNILDNTKSIEGLKGEIKALDIKIDTKIDSLNLKFDTINTKIDTKYDSLRNLVVGFGIALLVAFIVLILK